VHRRPILTQCGIRPRAFVSEYLGNEFTFQFPCGYTKTEVLMVGHGAYKQPAGSYAAAFFAKYWRQGQGVSYECPRCRRRQLRATSLARHNER
jgi:hypothetical protein